MLNQLNQLDKNIVELLIPLSAIIGGVFIALTAIITTAFRRTAQTRAREQSRREVAAYVAEGSISAEDGARLLAAGVPIRDVGSKCS